MSRIWNQLGRMAFWLGRPVLSMYLKKSQRARVALRSGNRLLVTKGWLSDGKWSLPGGGLHAKETPLRGALRELREETGVTVEQTALTEQGNYLFANYGIQFRYVLFNGSSTEELPLRCQRFEIIAAEWVEISQLNSENSAPDVLQALRSNPHS